MKYCDGCGERATSSCPYCGADSCNECIPICDHDARKPKQAQGEGSAVPQPAEPK